MASLQRSLEAARIPHTTASSAVMALTFHKGQTTRALREAGLPVAASAEVAPGETWDDQRQRDVLAQLGLPVFVKPNEAGSSLGISKVNDARRCGLPSKPHARKMGGQSWWRPT